MSTELLLLLAFLFINGFSFLLMGLDKSYAIHDRYRISEDMLMTMALIGGSLGILTGMYRFHHKTKKAKFTLGIPLILIVQVILVIAYGYQIL